MWHLLAPGSFLLRVLEDRIRWRILHQIAGRINRVMASLLPAGSIVFYPGHYVHEVTPVVSGPGDFAAARLSVVVTFVPEAA